jgi:uncharacterized membrane protein YoaK (UPF0700 family)
VAEAQLGGQSVRNLLLVALTFTSGAIDAISYLGLGRVFTANMTGNMVLLGLAAGRVEGLEALRSATAFVGFAAGVAIGARILGRGKRVELWPDRVTLALAIELLLLVALALGWVFTRANPVRPWLEVLISLSAAAMGIPSAAAAHLAVPSVSTTYVTGTTVSLMTELSLLGHPSTGWPLRLGIVVALGIGAAVDALVLQHWPIGALLVPVASLAAVTFIAARSFPPPS